MTNSNTADGNHHDWFIDNDAADDNDYGWFMTDSEAAADDDCGWLTDNDCGNKSFDEYDWFVTDSDATDGDDYGCFVTNSDAADDDDCGWLMDNDCVNKSIDESMGTGLTMACSEIDTLEDAPFYIGKEEGFCTSENAHASDVNEIDSGDDDGDCNDSLLVNDCVHQGEDESIGKALPMVVSYEADTFGDISSYYVLEEWLCTPKRREADTLDTILYHPLYLSALLTILAHRPTKRDSKLSKTLPCSHSQEAMPTIDA